jgi:hypothetical protein
MTLDEIKTLMDQAREAMRTNGRQALGTLFTELFAELPEIKKVVWEQYTPYFNDGESCEFSVNTPRFLTEEEEDYEDEGECLYESIRSRKNGRSWASPPVLPQRLTSAEERQVAEMEKVRKAFSLEEVFELTFGDHCRVVATRDGFEVSSYEHE